MLGATSFILALALSRSATAELEERGRYSWFHRFPKYHYDKNTIKYCAWWLDNTGDWTCDRVKNDLEIPLKNFHDWNPSIPIDCRTLPREQSFCIAGGRRPVSTTTQTILVPTTDLDRHHNCDAEQDLDSNNYCHTEPDLDSHNYRNPQSHFDNHRDGHFEPDRDCQRRRSHDRHILHQQTLDHLLARPHRQHQQTPNHLLPRSHRQH
ncbi:hypothetical protein B0T16DRAFT_392796 [Cercophora newfieldiana]|uniref:LysM domain-containing protein n=1 Tax=Cercophora newfieldiana TaxID=92897 RepID=A0AA39Y1T5_9PEZI|nr:hypothetical protein B0T16DRAFT_392796 [Cercophora newfieldiana]